MSLTGGEGADFEPRDPEDGDIMPEERKKERGRGGEREGRRETDQIKGEKREIERDIELEEEERQRGEKESTLEEYKI